MGHARKPGAGERSAHASRIVAALSSSLGRRDEGPNRALADQLARGRDTALVAELVALCSDSRAAIRRDAAKCLAALAARAPDLVAPHVPALGPSLDAREGVVVWSLMETLSRVAPVDPRAVFALLPGIIRASDCGSVIARDHAVRVLTHFLSDPRRRARVLEPLARILRTCPLLQFPTYVELVLDAAPPDKRAAFVAITCERMRELARPSSIRRVERALRSVRS